MILTSFIICFFIPWIVGSVLIARLSSIREIVTCLASGLIVGLSIYVTIAFALTSILTLHYASLVAIFILLFLTAVIALRFSRSEPDDWCFDPVLLGIGIAVLCVSLPSAVRILLLQSQDLLTGHLNCYGDLPLHIGIIQSFVEAQSFPPENPIFSGASLAYPFLADFYSSLIIVHGGSLRLSLVLPLVFLVPASFVLLAALVIQLTGSRLAACLTVFLFLFSGGTLGFLRLGELWDSGVPTLKEFLHGKPSYYSGSAGDKARFFLPNPLLAYFIPQRSFLFGFPLALSILHLFLERKRRGDLVLAGIAAGMLPLLHAHSVLVLALVFLVLFSQMFLRGEWRVIGLFVVSALPLGILEVAYYLFFSEVGNHIHLRIGWLAGDENLFLFWFRNSGLLIPLVLVALVAVRSGTAAVRLLAAVGVALFVLANTFLFARWEWDNTKLLVYAFVFILPLISLSLAEYSRRIFLLPLVVLFLFVHSISGIIDIVRYGHPQGRAVTLWDSRAIVVAKLVRTYTEPGAVILSAPIHNSITTLAGRMMYLGFPGMVWTHGGNPYDREKAIKKYYQGRSRYLPGDAPDYILVGPVERMRYRRIFYDPSWQKLFERDGIALFKLGSFPQNAPSSPLGS